MQLLCFIKEYLADPKSVGSFAPSSKKLAEMVTEAAWVREAECVVEFGPGTGVFTEVIASKIRPDATFIAIEISDDFVKLLRKRFPGVHIIHDTASRITHHLDAMGIEHCDCIVSGLPFALFEDKLQDELLDAAYEALCPGGVFVTFTYFLAHRLPRGEKLYRKLRQRYSRVERLPTVWANVFPAFAYRAIK